MDLDDKLFFRPPPVRDRPRLGEERPRFETCHHPQHRYTTLGGRTPWEVHTAITLRPLSRPFRQHRQRGLGGLGGSHACA